MDELLPNQVVASLLSTSAELWTEIGRQRLRIAQLRDARSVDLQLLTRRVEALAKERAQLAAELEQCLRQYGEAMGSPNVVPVASALRFEDLVAEGSASAAVKPEVREILTGLLAEIGANVRQGRERRLGKGRFFDEASRKAARYRVYLDALRSIETALRQQLPEIDARFNQQREAQVREAGALLQRASVALDLALADGAPPQLPWSDPRWAGYTVQEDWAAGPLFAGNLSACRDGALGPDAALGSDVQIPYFIDLSGHLRLRYDENTRSQALSLLESLLARRLVTVPPGEVRFHIFDPVGLGQSLAALLPLADYNADLIGGKVWSSSSDLRGVLETLSAHLEVVVQKYLRTAYRDIYAFNREAGELAEPIRFLLLLDFPTGFDPESAAHLKRIIENGQRCGVHLLVGANSSRQTVGDGQSLQVVDRLSTIILGAPFAATVNGYRLQLDFAPDSLSGNEHAVSELITEIGRLSLATSDRVVTLERLFGFHRDAVARGLRPERDAASSVTSLTNHSSWWRHSTVAGISSPVGQRGAREASILTFDSGDHSGALLVGRPGSGKSTLLHTFVTGIATQYSPQELELYLIDFKEGVEFKSYASAGLPHARCVGIESDREFGLSVLQSLVAEISSRGELLRSSEGHHSGLEALRRATGESMARVLLVFDEFHVLFARNDKIGLAAADLLEQVIRQGRSFGIHVLLASQSLAGLDALGSHVPQLLPVRILLPAAEADGRRVLGEGNGAGAYLTSRGEGVLNPAGGAVEANERFQAALVPDEERLRVLTGLRSKADAAGFTRRPIVFDGRSLLPLSTFDPREFREELQRSGVAPLRIRTGVPMAIHGTAELSLRREAGANVVLIARTEAEGAIESQSRGLPVSQLVALVASLATSSVRIYLVDFMPVDEEIELALGPLADLEQVSLYRARQLAEVVERVSGRVNERLVADDMRASVEVLVLFGLHRARDLDASGFALEADASLPDALENILRNGPEVGIHTWAWADSPAGLSRRLSSTAVREFGWRIAGRMSADDSQMMLGSEVAASLRPTQIVMVDQDLGTEQRASSLGLPEQGWLDELIIGTERQGW